MTKINENFLKLPKNYLFAEIANGVEKYKREYPNTEILKLGIGDVTRPLPRVIVKAMQEACEEMLNEKTFRGYGPEQGYEFLRNKISECDYPNLNISPDDIKSTKRNKEIAYPRQICMYLCRKMTADSLQAVGNSLGKKDHTTIIHGEKKISDDLKKDENLQNTIDVLIKKINPPK